MSPSCLEHLRREHREVEAVLTELKSLLEAGKAAPLPPPEASPAFEQVIQRFTDLVMPHLRKEDEILFPALEEFLPREKGPLAVLRSELSSLREYFRSMRDAGDALFAANASPELAKGFQRSGRATLQGLRDHIYKQDRILFPLVARFLWPELDARLLRQMEAMDAGGSIPLPPKQQK